MKKTLLYAAVLMSGIGLFQSCTGDMEMPPMIAPEATWTPNTTIAALKADVWQTDRNYVTEVGQRDGHDVIIAGRVVSSDKAGNVFKNVVLQDETAALTIAINAYDLYETYQPGQQIVVNLTGLKIGGYNSLLQVGGEGTYNGSPSMTFMEEELFAKHAQQNGLADMARVDTKVTTIPELMTAKNSVEGLQKWQSQLIRLDNVTFEDPGKPFAEGGTTNRYIKDGQGNRINVRNSSYADFASDLIPSGTGAVVGILSYYGTDWQIILNDLEGLIGFDAIVPDDPSTPDNPVGDGDGTETSPYSLSQVVAMNPTSTSAPVKSGVWVSGYIVGSMPTGDGVSTLLSATTFGLDNAAETNLVLGPTADCTDPSLCVGVQLPIAMREALSLAKNPDGLGKQLQVKGDIAKYCGGPGVKTLTSYILDGVAMPEPEPSDDATFQAVTTVTSGKSYALVMSGKVALPFDANKTYGYMMVADATMNGSDLTAPLTSAFEITAVDGGYTIRQNDGRYLSMAGTYNSFNLSSERTDGDVWTVTFNGDGSAIISNVLMSKSIQYDPQYGSLGSYPDVRGVYPTLYEKK